MTCEGEAAVGGSAEQPAAEQDLGECVWARAKGVEVLTVL